MCVIFILTSYSLYTQVVLILILIDVQYLYNSFSYKKGLNGQSNSSSDSHQLMKNPHSKIPHSPIDLNAV